MERKVDSFRYLDFISRTMVKAWIEDAAPCTVPWAPLARPLSECTVAMLSSGGIALKTDKPFDQDGERRNPWWGIPDLPHHSP